ncbi:MAG: CBS domain-containing protein, partial [Pseudomonadota bacterium]
MSDSDGSSDAARGAPKEDEVGATGIVRRWLGLRTDTESEDKNGVAAAILQDGPGGLNLGMANLREMRVEDVEVPKGEIVAVDVETSLDDLLDAFRDSGFSRLPVYEDTLDMPLGMVLLKDVALHYGFNCGEETFDLRALLRP